jgi:hypothetical protein
MHKRRECHCEVIFDAEERERRLRPRGSKGKGKGKELARIEFGGQGGDEGEVGAAGVAGVAGVAAASEKGHGLDTPNTGHRGVAEAGPRKPRQDWAPDAQMAAYQYVGYQTNGTGNGPHMAQYGQGGGFPGGGNTQMDLVPMAQRPGYPAGGGVGKMDLDQVAAGHGFPVGGVVPREHLWEGQMEIGQPGAGMKWYPQQHEANMPTMPDLYSSPTSIPDKMPRTWQRSKSEPPEEINHPASPALNFTQPVTVADAVAIAPDLQQPAIVSSDMAQL